MTAVPGQVRHYWRGGRHPFLNLSELEGIDLDGVIDGLVQERRDGVQHRSFGRRYMDLRRRTEAKMRDLFVQAGGKPERPCPHYFVLGESGWFRNLAFDMQEIALELTELPDSATSFTYPDSFTAMGLAAEYGLPYEVKPYHEQVFRLSDLDGVVQDYGLPEDVVGGYEGYEHQPFEHYIEVQLWSDEPVAHILELGG